MAPVAVEREARYLPAAVVATHLVSAVALTTLVGCGLYRSYVDLSPSQSVRQRLASRERLVPVFAALAVLSLLIATYSTADYAALSYRVWAYERGIESGRWFPYLAGGNLAHWLTDTSVYQDALEIVAEKARRFWWGQQLDHGTVNWALLLAIEGRRRRIPYLWAYLSLAQLVNLSFAQNLFYLALLLTPSPLPEDEGAGESWIARILDRAFPPKPVNWSPFPLVYLSALQLTVAATKLLPLVAGAAGSPAVATLGMRMLSFALLAAPAVVPQSWGTAHLHPHEPYREHMQVFRGFALANLVMHAHATFSALAYNAPGSHYHRHSVRIPFDTARRSEWERTSTAVAKVLGSTADHPVVAAVGRDVLLSALSLGLWAAVRAMDSRHIARYALPLDVFGAGEDVKSIADDVAGAAEGKLLAMQQQQHHHHHHQAAGPANSEPLDSPTGAPRRRGRPARNAAVASVGGAGEEAEKSTVTTPRRRGRPRKVKQEDSELDETYGDPTYEPGPQEAASAVEGDVLPDEELDWEAAALTWGITIVGGLGCGSAGVFGGECISR